MADVYESVLVKYRNSPSVVIVFILALVMFILGMNHFVEDTYSSKYGLENLETFYNLNVQIFQWTYWTMSLAPQVSSMVFAYIYLSDTSKKWALYLSLLSQGMDFVADSWYRSNGQLFTNGAVMGVSTVLTFIYFSVGSEFFLTIGGGLILKLFAPFITQFRYYRTQYRSVSQTSKSEKSPAPVDYTKVRERLQRTGLDQKLPPKVHKSGNGGGQSVFIPERSRRDEHRDDE